MPQLVSLIGLSVLAIALLGVGAPGVLVNVLNRIYEKAGVWTAVVGRVVVGIVFIVAAPQCRDSDFILIVGIVALVAGVSFAFAGKRRLDAMLAWFNSLPSPAIRAWCFVSACFCAYIVYAGGWLPLG